MFQHVLFDLDGTLVDSADGVLTALRRCLGRAGLEPRVELNRSLIGPPLPSMLATTTGSSDQALLSALERDFRTEYDSAGWRESPPYPGVPAALDALHEAGVGLHLVTNKRMVPTLKILDAHDWTSRFRTINTLDTSGGAGSKSDVVARLLPTIGGARGRVALVGDSLDDARAAQGNNIDFAWASWGYGSAPELAATGVRLGTAHELVPHLLRPPLR